MMRAELIEAPEDPIAFVRGILHRHFRVPAWQEDEILSAGCFGYAAAVREWDPDRGVPFQVYAASRICWDASREFARIASQRGRAKPRASRHTGRPLKHRAPGGWVDVETVFEDFDDPWERITLSVDAEVMLEPPADTFEVTARMQSARALVPLINQLPPQYRLTLMLYYFDGLDGPEIAKLLRLSPARIGQRLRCGLERLRVALQEPEHAALRAGVCEGFLMDARVV